MTTSAKWKRKYDHFLHKPTWIEVTASLLFHLTSAQFTFQLSPAHSVRKMRQVLSNRCKPESSSTFWRLRVVLKVVPQLYVTHFTSPESHSYVKQGEDCFGVHVLVPWVEPVEMECVRVHLITENTVTDYCRFSIVAIHGLDGHCKDSWTTKQGTLWLRDFFVGIFKVDWADQSLSFLIWYTSMFMHSTDSPLDLALHYNKFIHEYFRYNYSTRIDLLHFIIYNNYCYILSSFFCT